MEVGDGSHARAEEEKTSGERAVARECAVAEESHERGKRVKMKSIDEVPNGSHAREKGERASGGRAAESAVSAGTRRMRKGEAKKQDAGAKGGDEDEESRNDESRMKVR